VKIALAAVALLLAWAGTARAQPAGPSCQTFTRSGAAPEIVRSWLERSGDARVLACTPPPAPGGTQGATLYTGESAVTRSRSVCRYSSHLLIRVGAGAANGLQRAESAEGVGMAIAGGGGDCPAPHSAPAELYTMTYDLTPALYESIMAFWAATAASAAAFDHQLACCTVRGSAAATPASAAASATRERLRAAIAVGRMQAAAVTRIVRLAGHGMRRRYALFVADPDSRPADATVYVIYLSRSLFGGPWRFTDITDVAG
jgi:hypothetical protein